MCSSPKQPRDPLAALGLDAKDRAALDRWMGVPPPQSIDRVWTFVGGDVDGGCDPPDGLDRAALLEGLTALALAEKKTPPGGSRLRQFLARHAVLALIAGAVRIKEVQRRGESSLGLSLTQVAAAPLDPTRTIAKEDLTLLYLPAAAGTTADAARIVGRRPAQPVPGGHRIELSNLQVQQVVARSALASGEPIKIDSVRLAWSKESSGSARQLSEVVGRCVAEPVPSSEAIVMENVRECPPPKQTPTS